MRNILISALVLCLTALPARANTVFVPTSGWLVGPATLVADDEGQLPCVMMNQFNNGFAMRVSGGGGQILGFAVDVRQNFFTPGETYDLGIAIEPGFRKVFKAQSYDPATIMAATQDAPEFYKALQNAREMTLGIQGKVIKFVMLGARDGLERVENCYDPKGSSQPAPRRAAAAPVDDTPQPKAGMRTADAPPPKENSVAAAYRDLLMREEGSKAAAVTAPAVPPESVDIPLTAKAQGQSMPPPNTAIRPQPPQEPVSPQTANAMALDKMEPAAGGGSRLDKIFAKAEESIRTSKPAEEGAAKPIAPTAQASLRPAPAMPAKAFPSASYQGQPLMPNGMVPIVPPAPSAPRQVQVSAPEAAAQPVAAPAQAAVHSREWRAQPGTNLREVLENWSINAGARLVWKAQGDFTMPAGLTAQGTYESAVLSALKQFESGDGVQPLGQIYADPATGQKVLVISE